MDQNPATKEELQALVKKLQTLVDSYDSDADHIKSQLVRAEIRDAALQVTQAASTPDDLMWHQLTGMAECVTMRLALQLQLFEGVPLTGSISPSELAKKVNATQSLVTRTMRPLVATRIFDQTPDGDYVHTRFSKAYINASQPGPAAFYQLSYDVYLKPIVSYDEYMTKNTNDGLCTEPTSNYTSPAARYYGTPGQNTWEAIASHPEVSKNVQIALSTIYTMVPPLGYGFSFSQFQATSPADDRVQFVDVGGGGGRVLCDILTGTPELDPTKCVLQDLEPVLELAEEARKLGVKTQGIDFHKEQPIKGARAYYMHLVTHDYHDPDLTNMFTHIASAMAPDSKFLISENILPDRLSSATLLACVLDQLMFCVSGKERTVSEFESVLKAAGMRLNHVYYHEGKTGGVVEACLA